SGTCWLLFSTRTTTSSPAWKIDFTVTSSAWLRVGNARSGTFACTWRLISSRCPGMIVRWSGLRPTKPCGAGDGWRASLLRCQTTLGLSLFDPIFFAFSLVLNIARAVRRPRQPFQDVDEVADVHMRQPMRRLLSQHPAADR